MSLYNNLETFKQIFRNVAKLCAFFFVCKYCHFWAVLTFFTVKSGLYDVCVGGGMFPVISSTMLLCPMEQLWNMTWWISVSALDYQWNLVGCHTWKTLGHIPVFFKTCNKSFDILIKKDCRKCIFSRHLPLSSWLWFYPFTYIDDKIKWPGKPEI